MYTLYMAKGSSALAAHILLEEIGAPYQTQVLSVPDGEHLSDTYLSVNPRGRVPAIATPHGVLTENPAILAYLAQAHPEKELAPKDPFGFATAQSANLYLASTMHPAFAHKLRGARYADSPDAITAMKDKVPANMAECARLIEDHLLQGPWVLGAKYSMCDPYFFLVHRWMAANDISTGEFPKIHAHAETMRARPATRAALEQHGL